MLLKNFYFTFLKKKQNWGLKIENWLANFGPANMGVSFFAPNAVMFPSRRVLPVIMRYIPISYYGRSLFFNVHPRTFAVAVPRCNKMEGKSNLSS